jgi:ABC-type lipoprotein export system ATPase subunit
MLNGNKKSLNLLEEPQKNVARGYMGELGSGKSTLMMRPVDFFCLGILFFSH